MATKGRVVRDPITDVQVELVSVIMAESVLAYARPTPHLIFRGPDARERAAEHLTERYGDPRRSDEGLVWAHRERSCDVVREVFWIKTVGMAV